jgi:hypothetical protein
MAHIDLATVFKTRIHPELFAILLRLDAQSGPFLDRPFAERRLSIRIVPK